MDRRYIVLLLLAICVASFAQYRDAPPDADSCIAADEVPVITIPLSGGVTDRLAEVSSLAWYGDVLILLPQFPERFPVDGGGSLFAISKDDILAYLDGESDLPISPVVIPFLGHGLKEDIPGFEGFEAIAFSGRRASLTVEAKTAQDTLAYLVSGTIEVDLSAFSLDDGVQAIAPQADLFNISDEAILVFSDQVLTFYEANGKNVNPDPVGHVFSLDLEPLGTIAFPNIEHRITDVTAPDFDERFWAVNQSFSGDIERLGSVLNLIAAEFGLDLHLEQQPHVERLVELQYTNDGVIRTQTSPIQLELPENSRARNWEGVARLDERGFLLITDKHPETIFAFVPMP